MRYKAACIKPAALGQAGGGSGAGIAKAFSSLLKIDICGEGIFRISPFKLMMVEPLKPHGTLADLMASVKMSKVNSLRCAGVLLLSE